MTLINSGDIYGCRYNNSRFEETVLIPPLHRRYCLIRGKMLAYTKQRVQSLETFGTVNADIINNFTTLFATKCEVSTS